MFWESVGQVVMVLLAGFVFLLVLLTTGLGTARKWMDFIYPPDHVKRSPRMKDRTKRNVVRQKMTRANPPEQSCCFCVSIGSEY
ncbi:MAG: hypothetical protein JWM11_1375 [Planctomycetaceae bacterium]|nr:hypothetical protein [Planctomycetaceae bacterium]